MTSSTTSTTSSTPTPSPSSQTRTRIENVAWFLIYGGLFAALVGIFTRGANEILGWVLIGSGVLEVAVGVVLIYVRSRMTEQDSPTPGTQGRQ